MFKSKIGNKSLKLLARNVLAKENRRVVHFMSYLLFPFKRRNTYILYYPTPPPPLSTFDQLITTRPNRKFW